LSRVIDDSADATHNEIGRLEEFAADRRQLLWVLGSDAVPDPVTVSDLPNCSNCITLNSILTRLSSVTEMITVGRIDVQTQRIRSMIGLLLCGPLVLTCTTSLFSL
jgi:hypothetical protein